MRLSIIIPIYNAQKYLPECLESVAACSARDIECILVNDGSTDDSLRICKEYENKDNRFHVIDKENEGVSVARNTGILKALGEYVFFLDADDYIDISKWNVILDTIKEVQYDFIAFSYYTLQENGKINEELFQIEGKETTNSSTVRRLILASPSLNTCWGKLMRLDIITNNNLEFNKGLKTGEDAVFVIDYFINSKTYYICNDCILYYRQHNTSAMRSIDIAAKLEDFKAIYYYRKELAKQWRDIELEKEMYRQFFSVITDLFFKYACNNSFEKSKKMYKEVMEESIVQEILTKTPFDYLTPTYKKLEYILISRGILWLLVIYFKLKSRFI